VPGLVEWVGEPSQFDCLVNGAKCCLDTACLHLVSSDKLSFPHPLSKNLKDHKSLWFLQFLKVWVDVLWKEFGPLLPIMVAWCLSHCHNSSTDVGINIADSTCLTCMFGRQQHIHDACWGSGKQD